MDAVEGKEAAEEAGGSGLAVDGEAVRCYLVEECVDVDEGGVGSFGLGGDDLIEGGDLSLNGDDLCGG